MALRDDAPGLEETFEPCRNECCRRVGIHPVHEVEDLRGIRPQTEVCSKCLDLVKRGASCSCGSLTLLEEPAPKRRRSFALHVRRANGNALCRAQPVDTAAADGLASVTCRACLQALERLMPCPACSPEQACQLCQTRGYVRRIEAYKRGLPL